MGFTQQIVDDKTGEIRSKRSLGENHNFVMVFREEMHSLRKIAIKDGKALAVFMLITEHMDQSNSLIVSRETIGEILGMSIATVDRKLKFLKDNNFITTIKSGVSSIYMINANIAWSTYGNMKKYAQFKASVLISKTEQDYKIKNSTSKTTIVKKQKK